MFGWRARIGFISPLRRAIHTSALEMQMAAPEGVLLHSAYIDGPRTLAREHLEEAVTQVDAAAEELVGTNMDVVVMGAAPVCLVGGSDTLATRIGEITGRPSTTVTAGLVNGMRRLDMQRIVAVSPYYPEHLAELLRTFLEDSGFDVVSLASKDVDFSQHKSVSEYDTYRYAKEAFLQAPGADGVVIVGGGAPVYSIIETLETDIGKPVITNNFASLWNVLDMANVRTPIHGFGKLLTCF